MSLDQFRLRKSAHWFIFFALLFVMWVLQFSAVGVRSFWEDETETARLVQESFSTIADGIRDFHPPLYWWSVSLWSQYFGATEIGLKSFSILCLTLVFLLTYKLASDLFDSQVGLTAVGLLTLSPLILTYGHNARYYSLAALLSLLAALGTYHYVRKTRWYSLTLYILAITLLIYTLYMGGAVLIALNLWWFIQWVKMERKSSSLFGWVVAQGLILLLYLPWLSNMVAASEQYMPENLSASNWLAQFALRVGYIGYAFGVGEFFSPLSPILWVGISLIAGLLIYAFFKATPNLWFLLMVLFVGITISILFNIFGDYAQTDWQNLSYRLFFVYPFFLIILAYGIKQLNRKWFWGVLAAILIVYGVGIFNYFTNRQVIKPILVVPWREIFTTLQAQAAEDAAIVCTNDDTACFYYQDRFGFDRFSPNDLTQYPKSKPAEIWWIQSHRGDIEGRKNANIQAFQSINEQYEQAEVYNFVPQDPGIAMLKARFLGTADYDYRVKVYHFVSP